MRNSRPVGSHPCDKRSGGSVPVRRMRAQWHARTTRWREPRGWRRRQPRGIARYIGRHAPGRACCAGGLEATCQQRPREGSASQTRVLPGSMAPRGAPRGASPQARSPLGPRATPAAAGAMVLAAESGATQPFDVEAVWLSQHLSSSSASGARGFDSFADMPGGLVPATPPGGSNGGAPRPAVAGAPASVTSPPGSGTATPTRSPTGSAEAGKLVAERWRRRMLMPRSASTDALDAWSATLGEAVSGVAISNADDEAHTLIRCASRAAAAWRPLWRATHALTHDLCASLTRALVSAGARAQGDVRRPAGPAVAADGAPAAAGAVGG